MSPLVGTWKTLFIEFSSWISYFLHVFFLFAGFLTAIRAITLDFVVMHMVADPHVPKTLRGLQRDMKREAQMKLTLNKY